MISLDIDRTFRGVLATSRIMGGALQIFAYNGSLLDLPTKHIAQLLHRAKRSLYTNSFKTTFGLCKWQHSK